MWKQLLENLRFLFKLAETLEQNRTDIKTLQKEVQQLSLGMQLMAERFQFERELAAKERENLRLELENQLLKRLPPPEK